MDITTLLVILTNVCCGVHTDPKYAPFALKNADWKKATGKDGKLTKHEASIAHKAAAESYMHRVTAFLESSE